MQLEEPSIAVPLLLTHGTADIITCPKASSLFVDKLACRDKTMASYPDAYHNRTCIAIYGP